MTVTRHGHHIPKTSLDNEDPHRDRARCGGIGLCGDCSKDASEASKIPKPVLANAYEDTSDYHKDNDRFLRFAKQYVVGAHATETSETLAYELTVDDLYIVWFAKVLNNWKALVSTSIAGDGLYFEVTHNGEKSETYVDTYKKSANNIFRHDNV